MKHGIPRLYAIVDARCFSERELLLDFGRELAEAGATLLQYRDKMGSSREILSKARELKRTAGSKARLIMNDRPDLCLAAGFDGIHLGQNDIPVASARSVLGNNKLIGYSAHNLEQAVTAEKSEADYVAIGPIFETHSKANPDPVVGVAGVKAVRRHVKKPLVAIGGITRENCAEVIAAGADSVAVIADLVPAAGQDSASKRVEEFLRRLE